jgi:hypothetical protein
MEAGFRRLITGLIPGRRAPARRASAGRWIGAGDRPHRTMGSVPSGHVRYTLDNVVAGGTQPPAP